MSTLLLVSGLARADGPETATGPRAVPGAKEEAPGGSRAPRNVILMIGDGMGLAQISAARYHKGRLALEDMEAAGFSYTYSREHAVTDSSASATALATGYLIVNGEVSIHPDGSRTKTVVEYAEERGMWTGLVVTCTITHATPASMVAHVKSRGSEMDIALQIAESDVEVILGGGWDYFLPLRTRNIDEPFRGGRGPDTASLGGGKAFLASGRDLLAGERETLIAENPRLGADGKPYGRRKDKRNLVDEMEKRGYRFVRTASELYLATVSAPEKVLGLFHSGAMPKASEGRTPSLSAMSLAALRVLARSPRGFFLMIEGSQVDWGGHANDFDYAVQEAADFDDALAAVQRFLKDEGIMDETLVVVTADHETGGLSLPAHPLLSRAFEPKWTTKSHTGIPVPVFACGPDAASFGGIQTHELLGRKLVERVAGRKIVFSYPETRRTPQPRAGDGPRTAGKF